MSSRRFVVLRHEVAPGDVHRDLLIEGAPEGKLFAWKLAGPLPVRVGESVAAERNFDHRPLYLDFEGEIPGDRGTVTRELAGVLEDVSGEPGSGRYVFRSAQGELELSLSPPVLTRRVRPGEPWSRSLL